MTGKNIKDTNIQENPTNTMNSVFDNKTSKKMYIYPMDEEEMSKAAEEG